MDQILQLVLNNGGVKKKKWIKFSNWCLTFRVIW